MARSRSAWKGVERSAGALTGGTRYPANSGGRLDTCGPEWACSVKNVRTLSLAQVEALAIEAAECATRLDPPRLGALVVKRSAGPGVPTPLLVVLTADTFRQWTGQEIPEQECRKEKNTPTSMVGNRSGANGRPPLPGPTPSRSHADHYITVSPT